MTKPPCGECAERTIEPNCHDTCKCYLEWRQEIRDIKAKMKKDMKNIRTGEAQLWSINLGKKSGMY